MKRLIYFDHNATTPLREEIKTYLAQRLELYGNASSLHEVGRLARTAIDEARTIIKSVLGVTAGQIIFTSGGSESNNAVLKGLTQNRPSLRRSPPHIITSKIEHPSVLGTCRYLESTGCRVTYLPVDRTGMVNPNDVEQAIGPSTILISVMTANNEVGTIQPVSAIGLIARRYGVPFHTDAVQAVGKIPVSVEEHNLDLLSLSGHKLNAPKGIGALYIRDGLSIPPLIHGGHQEFNLRAGTENTLGILALGQAFKLASDRMAEDAAEVARLRDRLEQGLLQLIPDVEVNGHPTQRLPGTCNLGFRFVEGESLLLKFDSLGLAVSTGSACSSGAEEPSPVLVAMGIPRQDAFGAVRFSLGYGNTDADVDYALENIPQAVRELREISPLYRRYREGRS